MPSRPDKKLCRTVDVPADSPNVLTAFGTNGGTKAKPPGHSTALGGFAVCGSRGRAPFIEVAGPKPPKKHKRTPAEQRRDVREGQIRRVGLIALYEEMLESHLASDAFDVEFVKRMLGVRETVLLMIEAAMPVPTAAAKLDDVKTLS